MAAPYSLSAFGLSIRSELMLLGAAHEAPPPRGRVVEVRAGNPTQIGQSLRSGATVLERRLPDGSLGMRVTQHPERGFAISAPGHGVFSVSNDGSMVKAASLEGPSWHWHRPLLSQVLPLAALLSGYELLHASAAELAGGAILISAPSTTGKTSLAVNLAHRGARLLTDDVASLEVLGGHVIVHPGSPVANVAREQLMLLPGAGRGLGTPLGESDKVHIQLASLTSGPTPLTALVFLQRARHIRALAFETPKAPDPRDLLGATYMPHIITPTRLRNQLDVCTTIARTVRVAHLTTPADVSAARLATAVQTWMIGEALSPNNQSACNVRRKP